MSPNNIQDNMDKLNPWFYEVDIAGVYTTPGIGSDCTPRMLRQRQSYRKAMLVDSICSMYTFEGKKILDVGCNCGYWGSEYIKLGAVKYTGIDGRERAINQGKLYWGSTVFAKHRYDWDFQVKDVNTCRLLDFKEVDFTLCAGILYHVKDYRKLLSMLSASTKEAMLVDTRVEQDEKEIKEPGDLDFNGLPTALTKTVPSAYKLARHLRSLNWKIKKIEPPKRRLPKGMGGKDDYAKGHRIALLCTK